MLLELIVGVIYYLLELIVLIVVGIHWCYLLELIVLIVVGINWCYLLELIVQTTELE